MVAVTKYARTPEELAKIEKAARAHGKDSDEYRSFMALRYTGMHVGCLSNPRSDIKEYDIGGVTHIDWCRPKKGARKGEKGLWERLPAYPKHPKLDFNIVDFHKDIIKRSRKKGNTYFYRLITKLGIQAGISDVSPNSLRHSHGIYLLDVVGLKPKDAAQYMGCTVKTLMEHYGRYGLKTAGDKIIAKMREEA